MRFFEDAQRVFQECSSFEIYKIILKHMISVAPQVGFRLNLHILNIHRGRYFLRVGWAD